MSGAEETYEIRVKGHLSPRFARHFDGFELSTGFHADGKPVSILSGTIADQSALHGTLTRIRDLGMEIVSINQVEEGPGN